MKTILFLASTLLLFFTANAQEPFATIELKSGNEVIAFDGGNTENAQKEIRRKGRATTNSNFGFITLDGGTLLYYSQSGEIEKLDIKDIKEVKIDSKK